MRSVARVLLQRVLRRYPQPTRLNFLGRLGRYAWLKDIASDLKEEFSKKQDEVIPQKQLAGDSLKGAKAPKIISGPLDGELLSDRNQQYRIKRCIDQREGIDIYSATDLNSNSGFTVYAYKRFQSDKAYIKQWQQYFKELPFLGPDCITLTNLRIVTPIAAILESYENKEYLGYLITPAIEIEQSLQKQDIEKFNLPDLIQILLGQVLQSLDFLHHQQFRQPFGKATSGLVHGNLTRDSLVLENQKSRHFIYLTDLLLWEQFSRSLADTTGSSNSISKIFQFTFPEATLTAVQQDLADLGYIIQSLLDEYQPEPHIAQLRQLKPIINKLQNRCYDNAAAAYSELADLIQQSPNHLIAPRKVTPQSQSKHSRLPLFGLGLAGVLMAVWGLRSYLKQGKPPARPPKTAACCLNEVSTPQGKFDYTSLLNGTWQSIASRSHKRFSQRQPKFQLKHVPSPSIPMMLKRVQSGQVAFAIMPYLSEVASNLMHEEIAYDGLGVFVPFSYTERARSLPTGLDGSISWANVMKVYSLEIDNWKSFSKLTLPINLYASTNSDVAAIWSHYIAQPLPLSGNRIRMLDNLAMFRKIIRDFEINQIGSIGIAPLSQAWGQCSIYPLAIKRRGKPAVQPWVLNDGQPIQPDTDLCQRKGSYFPDSPKFQQGEYPLSYPIVVVYPRDNRRSQIGKKFVELMRTREGQQMLQEAGFVPLARRRQHSVVSQVSP
ncbi:hypothetical protein IQ266_17185 [filamentous cyanobacterium LEGE 11480]|uniref:Protein kinase domain-containing protein n=1 Tax=Romeriopsis navalis LEGE 11480 TaxID=2777977 RepID=A0A928VNB6_9CYAN|nr:hypothetical protein [Romeriopsis navalis]MBE9031470.1 hypothetical protein [Romeriopsis navalis LEGE 11480]